MLGALLVPVGIAQVCLPELEAAIATSDDPAVVTGVDAARALAEAVRLVEPALPPLVVAAAIPVSETDPAADEVRYLAERRLLPPGWTADALTPAAWHEMTARFLAWYGLAATIPEEPPPDDRGLAHALGRVLERVGDAVRPAAVVVPADPAAGEPGFRGLVWNWTIFPRLVVFPPPSPGERREASIAAMETCARRIRHWFAAPGAVARDLFERAGSARMVVLGAEVAGSGAWWVPAGEELDVLTFDHPRVQEVEAYAALFDGPVVGVAQLARLLPRVRTNVSPFGLARYLQTPH